MPAPRMPTRRRLRTGLAAMLIALALAGCDAPEEKAESHYQRGMTTMAAGELDKAALDFRNALKLDGNHGAALLALAELEEKRGNFGTAVTLYTSLAERDAQHLDSRIRLAQLFLASGQADAATIYAGQAAKLRPDDPRVTVIRAGIALSRGNGDDAQRLAREALRIAPDDSTALMVLVSERVAASDPAGALEIIEGGLSGNAADLGLQVMKLRTLQGMDNGPEVEKQFLRLTELFPETPAFHDGFVKWLIDQGRMGDAERAARRFARAHPADAQAQIKLALITSRTAGAAAALAELKAIIEAFPREDERKFTELMMAASGFEDMAGQPEAALATLRELAASTADEANLRRVQLRLAQMLAARERWGEATELSESVLAKEPRNADALAIRAASRLAGGDAGKALEDLVAAQGAAPNAANIALLLGEAHERLGSATSAEEHYGRALALSGYAPDSGIKLAQFLMRYGRAERAMQVMEDVRASGKANRAALLLLAQLKLNARDWEGARSIAERLREVNASTGDMAADRIMAAALGGMNRQDERIALLQSGLARAPDGYAAAVELVSAHIRAGDIREAERLARQRLVEQPAHAGSHVLLGAVLAAAGRADEAEAAFKTAAAAQGGSAQADAALAEFYLRQGKPDKAEQAARAGLTRDGGNSALQLLLAGILEAKGAFGEAIAAYERLLQSDPTSTVVANNLASLLSERRDDPKALERAFTIASRFQNSDVPQFLDTLGWIHHLRGDHQAALPLLKRAAERLPNAGLVHFHLGMALKDAGQAEASARSLERAVKLAAGRDAPYLKTATAALQHIKSTALAN